MSQHVSCLSFTFSLYGIPSALNRWALLCWALLRNSAPRSEYSSIWLCVNSVVIKNVECLTLFNIYHKYILCYFWTFPKAWHKVLCVWMCFHTFQTMSSFTSMQCVSVVINHSEYCVCFNFYQYRLTWIISNNISLTNMRTWCPLWLIT